MNFEHLFDREQLLSRSLELLFVSLEQVNCGEDVFADSCDKCSQCPGGAKFPPGSECDKKEGSCYNVQRNCYLWLRFQEMFDNDDDDKRFVEEKIVQYGCNSTEILDRVCSFMVNLNNYLKILICQSSCLFE